MRQARPRPRHRNATALHSPAIQSTRKDRSPTRGEGCAKDCANDNGRGEIGRSESFAEPGVLPNPRVQGPSTRHGQDRSRGRLRDRSFVEMEPGRRGDNASFLGGATYDSPTDDSSETPSSQRPLGSTFQLQIESGSSFCCQHRSYWRQGLESHAASRRAILDQQRCSATR